MANIYKVQDGNSVFYVEAKTKASAMNHVARMTISAELASQRDLHEAGRDGTKILVAGEAGPEGE